MEEYTGVLLELRDLGDVGLIFVYNAVVLLICCRFVLVNTDERKCLSSVHPSGVLTGVDQSSAPGNCGNNSYFEG